MSDLCLLGDLKCVIYLDAEISHGRLQLGMPQEQLHGTEVLGAPIDRRCLSSAHRVCPVVGPVQSQLFDPVPDDPGVLAGAEMS